MTMQEASALDLDAEISAEAEIEKNETRDAVPLSAQAVRVDAHIEKMPADRRRVFQKVAALAKRAMKTAAEGDNVAAARLAHKAYLLAPDMALTNHVLERANDMYPDQSRLVPPNIPLDQGHVYSIVNRVVVSAQNKFAMTGLKRRFGALFDRFFLLNPVGD